MRLVRLETPYGVVYVNPQHVTHLTEAPDGSTRIHFTNREFLLVTHVFTNVAALLAETLKF